MEFNYVIKIVKTYSVIMYILMNLVIILSNHPDRFDETQFDLKAMFTCV